MKSDNPYAALASAGEEATSADNAENTEAQYERVRWRSSEAHVSAIGLVGYLPPLLYVFVVAGVLRSPARSAVRTSMLVALVLFGLSLALGAYRLRKLRRDGRVILTGFVLLVVVFVLFRPFQLGSLTMLAPPAIALYYLWFGSGAYVLGDQHARALAQTRGRPVPTATWGFVVFGLVVAAWIVAAIRIFARG